MVSVAVFSDIHGNVPALEAVMEDLHRLAPDHVVVAGDLVGRGPQSREVLDIVASTGWPIIMGNHEEYQIQCFHGDVPEGWEDGWWNPTRQLMISLGPARIQWMAELPYQHIVEVPGTPPIQVVHGSPSRINNGFYRRDNDEQVLEKLAGTTYPVVVGAHTHEPLERHVGKYHVLNAGSVGSPYGSPEAQYLVLTWSGQAWNADFRRVPYDRERALRLWHETGFWDTGVAAQIFAYEVETSRFHFYSYVRFCDANSLPYNLRDNFDLYLRQLNGNGHKPG